MSKKNSCAAHEVFRRVAVLLEFRWYIALGVIGVFILDLGRFAVKLERIGVHCFEEIALCVVGVLLHPAVGVGQLDRAVGGIVDIDIGAVSSVDHTGEIVSGIVEVGHLASVRIGNARLIADFIVGIFDKVKRVGCNCGSLICTTPCQPSFAEMIPTASTGGHRDGESDLSLLLDEMLP